MRALLIEDDSLLGSGLKYYLGKAGFLVEWLQDGRLAHAILDDNENFDLVIGDLDVPGISWKDWVAALKYKQPDVPVIIMSSGHRMTRLDIEGAQHLPKRFLSKKRFTNFIRSVLHGGSAESSPTPLLMHTNITLGLTPEVQVGREHVNQHLQEFTLLNKLFTSFDRLLLEKI